MYRGISSNGRALDLHSRGTGIDTRILHYVFLFLLRDTQYYLPMCISSHGHLLHSVYMIHRFAPRIKSPAAKPLGQTDTSLKLCYLSKPVSINFGRRSWYCTCLGSHCSDNQFLMTSQARSTRRRHSRTCSVRSVDISLPLWFSGKFCLFWGILRSPHSENIAIDGILPSSLEQNYAIASYEMIETISTSDIWKQIYAYFNFTI